MYTAPSMVEKMFRSRSEVSIYADEYIERIKWLIEKAETCQYLIDNYDNISNEEFYEKFKFIGINSVLDTNDFRSILELYYNKIYHGPVEIETKMYEYIIEEEEFGKDLERHRVKSGVELSVVYAPKTININRVYTKDEIGKLLNNNDIVIMHKDNFGTKYLSSYEEWPNFEVALDDSWEGDKFEVKGEKYYDTTIKYIKTINDVKKLKKTMKSILKVLKKEINTMNFLEQQFDDKRFQKKFRKLESHNRK